MFPFYVFQPCVNDPNEQDFLMEQLEALSLSESKELNQIFMHRIIDLRLTGRNTDRKLQEKIEREKRFIKNDKKISHDLGLMKVQNDELKKKIEELTKSRDKYKSYYILQEKENRKQERFSAGNGYSSRKTRERSEDEIETVEMETKAEVKRHKNGRKIIVEK